jgi:hypothetical protein
LVFGAATFLVGLGFTASARTAFLALGEAAAIVVEKTEAWDEGMGE